MHQELEENSIFQKKKCLIFRIANYLLLVSALELRNCSDIVCMPVKKGEQVHPSLGAGLFVAH